MGNWGAYPEEFQFTVDTQPPAAPQLSSPLNGTTLTGNTPTLTWQASTSPDVTGYLLDWNGTVQDIGTLTQFTTAVLPNGVYTWTVAAHDAANNISPYPTTWSFTVDAFIPGSQLYIIGSAGSDSGDCSNPASPCKTVAYGLSQAVAGDNVMVAAGTYTENLVISKPISISGGYVPAGVDWSTRTGETVIDGKNAGTVVTLQSGSNGTTLDGLTITGGNGTDAGGVYAGAWDITIQNSFIHDNTANGSPGWVGGGGVLGGVGGARVTITNSRIVGNRTTQGAGGVRVHPPGILIMTNTLVADNHGDWGLHLNGNSTLMNVTVANNTEGGLLFNTASGLDLQVTNTIIYGNSGGNLTHYGEGTVSVNYSAIEGGWIGTGNLNADPRFMDPTTGDYRLTGQSPCIDHGTPIGAPAVDMNGHIRDALPDIGAYEWVGFRIFLPLILRNK
jgi:hypothetical protein